MKNPDNSFPVVSLIIGLFVLILFAFSNYRAVQMGMTHDESSTFLNYASTDIWSCFNKASCWGTANNHLLNTILFQQTVKWFGLSEWSIRLPNILAHLLYLLSSWYLICLLTRNGMLRITGFVLLNFNPYLLDFFVVARGYGLAMGLIMASITCLFLYVQQRRIRWLWLLFSLSFLSVMAVFTSLIFWMAAWGTLIFIQGYFLWQKKVTWKHTILCQLIPFGFTLLLGFILYQPIQWLQQGGEFRWGAPNLYHTFYFLVVDSLYNLRYIGNEYNNKLVFQIVAGLFLLSGIVITFLQVKNKSESPKTINFLMASVLLLFPILIVLAQYWLLGSLFLVNRKSLLFIPLAGIVAFLTIQYIQDQNKIAGNTLAIVVVIFSLIHFGRSFRTDTCREWWYDEYTERVATFFDQEAARQDTLKIGTHWMFHPTLEFYRGHVATHPWEKATYSKELLRDSTFDYFYIFRSDYDQLKTHYYPIDTLGYSFFLLENRKRLEGK